jgi:hypothetical protein
MKLPKQFLGEKPPAWAMPIGRQEFNQFKSQVNSAINDLNLEHETEWNKGGVLLKGCPLFFGFQALIVSWKETHESVRSKLVQSFADAIRENIEAANLPIADHIDDLRIRLASDNGMPTNNKFISRQIGDHIHGILMLERPNAVAPVSVEMAQSSGKSNEELLDLALEKVWKHASPRVSRKETDIGIFTYLDYEVFGATMMMFLDRFTEQNETYWACAPCRDTTILLKPNSFDREILEKFFQLVGLTSQQSNYSIEPFVFRWQDGELTDLCEVKDDHIALKD